MPLKSREASSPYNGFARVVSLPGGAPEPINQTTNSLLDYLEL